MGCLVTMVEPNLTPVALPIFQVILLTAAYSCPLSGDSLKE